MRSPLRLGMVFSSDPLDQGAISGMPYAAALALERRGCQLVRLRAGTAPAPKRSPLKSFLKGLIPPRVGELPSHWRLRSPGCVLNGAKAAAERLSAQLEEARREQEVDALIGMCVSVPLAFLSTDLPIVYASDATARVVLSSYPRYARRPKQYLDECEECERRTLHRAARVGLASEVAVQSAIEDYGVDRSKVSLLPLGCHVLPDRSAPLPTDVPTRAKTTLLIVASDPERKRIGLAINVVSQLARRGVNAELVHIGAPDKQLRHPLVRTLGPLRLSDPADRARHIAAIREAHLSILPSIGEAFGIAPAESALAGRPAIVSDAGGLPTVVRHGDTGLVIPTAADASEWAEAILRLIDQPERYRAMAAAARTRAWASFTWDAWAETAEQLVRAAVAAPEVGSSESVPDGLQATR